MKAKELEPDTPKDQGLTRPGVVTAAPSRERPNTGQLGARGGEKWNVPAASVEVGALERVVAVSPPSEAGAQRPQVAEVLLPPDPKTWKVEPPAAGQSGPLRIVFPEPLDHPLLHRLLRVSGPDGVLPGETTVGREEREWSFTPDAPWTPGPYRILVDTTLEDLAGNRIGKPFEVDAARNLTQRARGKPSR